MSTVVSWIVLNASTLRRRRIAPTVVPLLHFTRTWSTIRVAMFLQGTFTVFGSPSASNPLGFCHVQKEARTKSGYTCTGKDCRSYSSKAKGIAVKACCKTSIKNEMFSTFITFLGKTTVSTSQTFQATTS